MAMIANYHTHTPRCKHAIGDEREYVERAIALGFKELGFSDHAPMPLPDGISASRRATLCGMRMELSETEDYVDKVLSLRREYADDISIFLGFEVEYFHSCFDRFLEHISDYPIDYLILGQHFPDPLDDSTEYYGNRTRDTGAVGRYVDSVIAAVESGKMTYIAHPDLPACPDLGVYQREMTRLIECANAHSTPLEINFYGLQEMRNYPTLAFWQLAAKIGCDVVFGSDAHRPENLQDPYALSFAEELVRCNPRLRLLDTVPLRPVK